jgi:hypothetical protein
VTPAGSITGLGVIPAGSMTGLGVTPAGSVMGLGAAPAGTHIRPRSKVGQKSSLHICSACTLGYTICGIIRFLHKVYKRTQGVPLMYEYVGLWF